jgi:hypothetical protein
MRRAGNIDEVLAIMDDLVDESVRTDSPLGYFAAMYRAVTREVRRGIHVGLYEDGARMDRFDTAFANLYFEALDRWQARLPVPKGWRIAFDAARDSKLLIVQHLLLGMNAHINHDLGIAAAAIAPGAELNALRVDFERINDTLARLIDGMEDAVSALSPAFRLMDIVGMGKDEAIADFSIRNARQEAWNVAEMLAHLPDGHHEPVRRYVDRRVGALAELIRAPRGALGGALGAIRLVERHDLARFVARLTTN